MPATRRSGAPTAASPVCCSRKTHLLCLPLLALFIVGRGLFAAPPPARRKRDAALRTSGAQPRLPPGVVCEDAVFAPGGPTLSVAIYVFGWRRLASLQRTVRSLQSAEYCNRTLSLTLLLDSGASPAVEAYARGVAWPHGSFRVSVEPEQRGIRGMWIGAMADAIAAEGSGAHVLPLEDDVAVSPLYYWWMLRATAAYGPFGARAPYSADGPAERRQLVGISLYTPRLNEVHYPHKPWKPPQAVGSAPAFLLQVPCSWGALFFHEHWKAFLAFYRLRAAPPFFNFTQEASQAGAGARREILGDVALGIPGSRTNTWPRSWKRFMFDFMYGRGEVMLYASAAEQLSFSTTYMERGEHTAKDGHVEAIHETQLRPDVELDRRKTVPLWPADVNAARRAQGGTLPPFGRLPVVSIYHHRSTLQKLAAVGNAFVRGLGLGRRAPAEAGAGDDEAPPSAEKYAALARTWLAGSSAGAALASAR